MVKVLHSQRGLPHRMDVPIPQCTTHSHPLIYVALYFEELGMLKRGFFPSRGGGQEGVSHRGL